MIASLSTNIELQIESLDIRIKLDLLVLNANNEFRNINSLQYAEESLDEEFGLLYSLAKIQMARRVSS